MIRLAEPSLGNADRGRAHVGRFVIERFLHRGNVNFVEAVETIEWLSSMISSKVWRAICGRADGWEGIDEAQTDFNGSAKVALLGIAESLYRMYGAGFRQRDMVPLTASLQTYPASDEVIDLLLPVLFYRVRLGRLGGPPVR